MGLSRWVGLWTALVLCMWRQTVAEEFRNIRNESPADNEVGSSGQMEAVLDGLTSLDRRITSLDRSVGELKEQMSQLLKISSDGGVLKVLQDLQGVCEELSASRPSQQGHVPSSLTPAPEVSEVTDSVLGQSHTCPQHPASSDVVVTAVMKTDTDTAYIVTVCYVGPEKPQVFQQLRGNGKSEPLEHDDVGVVTTRRNKTNTGDPPYLGLNFIFQSSSVHMTLRLDEKSPDVVHFPTIQLKVEPGNEIIYNSGSDVDIKIHVINEADETLVEQLHDMTSLYLKSSSEADTVNQFLMRPNIELPEEISDIQFTELGRSEGHATQLLHIPYSPERARGLLVMQMNMIMNCSDNCLVKWITMSHLVVFYPSGYSKPFPDNFVGFTKEKRPWGNSDETEEVQCYEENELRNCLLRCRAVGDDPTVTLARADPLTPTSAHTDAVYDDSPYFASQYWDLDSPVQQDAGLYTCNAKSRDGRHVISRTMTLSVGKVAEILRELTSVTLENGSLTAVCTAHGIPAPTVRFAPYYDSDPTDVIDHADVTPTKLNDTTSQATFVLPDWRKYDRNNINNIYCFAENVEHTDDRQHMVVEDDM